MISKAKALQKVSHASNLSLFVCCLAITPLAGMIAGLGITLLYVFQHKGIMFIPGTSFLGSMEENWFFGITPNAFGAVGAIVNFAVAFAVSSNTEAPPEEAVELVERIRTPGD